jgi:predicted transcriptional regulator
LAPTKIVIENEYLVCFDEGKKYKEKIMFLLNLKIKANKVIANK